MRYVPVGAQIYVYVQRMDAHAHLEQIFREVAAAGYDGIELFASTLRKPADVERARALSDEQHLRIVAAYFSGALWDASQQSRIIGDVRCACDRLQSLHAKLLVVGNHHKSSTKSPKEVEQQNRTLRECIAVARDHGIALAYHTYSPDLVHEERELTHLAAALGDELVLAPDLNWIARAGVDPADFLRRWRSRVRHLHVRDEANGCWVEALGDGNVDFRALREVIDEIEFEGWIIAELANEKEHTLVRSIGESLKLSREHLLATMGF